MASEKGKPEEIMTEIVTEETISKYMEFLGNEDVESSGGRNGKKNWETI